MLVGMATRSGQQQLFSDEPHLDGGTTIINERCQLQVQGDCFVVVVCGVVVAHFSAADRFGEALAMVNLVERGHARQTEVASAFGCSVRTVRRNQRRFEAGGMAALGRPRGYPRGQPRLPASRRQLVHGWKTEGVPQRQIAQRLGISEKAVRNLLQRMGWTPAAPEQRCLDLADEGADPKLSGVGPKNDSSRPPAATDTRPGTGQPTEIMTDEPAAGADPKLSGFDDEADLPAPATLDIDPQDRQLDRVLACMGLLDDAAPLFRPGSQVPGAGVLLAVPALVDTGVFDIARDVFGSIGPAFYGLRTTMATLLLMALLRIKRPEGLKEHSPVDLGRLLGLDRAPEVKTLRRKLARLAAVGRAADFGRVLAERRVKLHGHALGFLYVDGHVRAYHGKRSLPKTHVARIRLSMHATTDYWVNDAQGEPLFVVTTEANKGLVKMLPQLLDEVRQLVGDRRVTVVFDRGGWSPKLFARLFQSGFDILTYRKGRCRKVPRRCFCKHQATIDERKVHYVLADQNVDLFYGSKPRRKRLRLRQVTRLSTDGHQTPIITSRRDLSAVEVAYRMFERWRQENFFKYLRQQYALDALVDYGVEPADASRTVPNPKRRAINAELRKAYTELNLIVAAYGAEAFTNVESVRRTMRGFKIANASLGHLILEAMQRVSDLERKRAKIPTRVPVQQVTKGQVIKLSVERKHLTDLLKMVAYQAEGDLLRLVTPHYRRAEDEGRTLVQNALANTGDIEVSENGLHITIDPLSSPHRTQALVALCEHLNKTKTNYPGTNLRLHFDVNPAPEPSLAFPGPRPPAGADPGPRPDISTGG